MRRRSSIKLDRKQSSNPTTTTHGSSSSSGTGSSPSGILSNATTLQQIEAAKLLVKKEKEAEKLQGWEAKLNSLGIKSSGVTLSHSNQEVKRITAIKDKKNKVSPWIKVRTAIRLGLGLQKKDKKKISYEQKLQQRRNERFQKVLRLTEQRKKIRQGTGSNPNPIDGMDSMHPEFSQTLVTNSNNNTNTNTTTNTFTAKRADWEEDLQL